jgi:exosortase E/protease (VPEID-CTERM system)
VSHRSAIAVSVVAGLAAWVFGLAVQQFWRPLAQATLFFANGILQQMYGDVAFDLAAGTVGTPNLVIEIAPQCSGVEGIALVTVFVAVYLWLFRDRVAFPRSIWLFPAGIVAIWFANVLRIVAILAVGTSISPAIAVQGFHSQAGWIAFTAIALGLVGISHRYGLALTEGSRRMLAPRTSAPALLVPLMATLAVSMVTAAFSSGFDALYPVGVVVTALVLRHYRASYRALEFKPSLMPVAIGVAVFAAWIALRSQVSGGAGPAAHLPELPSAIALVWIVFRVIGSVVTVPIAEELAFRGYLLRKLVASDFEKVPPDRFTWLSFIGSSVLFGLMHQSWLAGTVAGAGFALAMYHRGRVTDAIVAHMTANALVAVCVLVFGYWDLWL